MPGWVDYSSLPSPAATLPVKFGVCGLGRTDRLSQWLDLLSGPDVSLGDIFKVVTVRDEETKESVSVYVHHIKSLLLLSSSPPPP